MNTLSLIFTDIFSQLNEPTKPEFILSLHIAAFICRHFYAISLHLFTTYVYLKYFLSIYNSFYLILFLYFSHIVYFSEVQDRSLLF